jgi:hypothetical protein
VAALQAAGIVVGFGRSSCSIGFTGIMLVLTTGSTNHAMPIRAVNRIQRSWSFIYRCGYFRMFWHPENIAQAYLRANIRVGGVVDMDPHVTGNWIALVCQSPTSSQVESPMTSSSTRLFLSGQMGSDARGL